MSMYTDSNSSVGTISANRCTEMAAVKRLKIILGTFSTYFLMLAVNWLKKIYDYEKFSNCREINIRQFLKT